MLVAPLLVGLLAAHGGGQTPEAESLYKDLRTQRRQGDYPAALERSRRLLAARRDAYSADDWRVREAEQWVSDLTLMAQLPPEDQQRLGEAERLTVDLAEYEQNGDYDEALKVVCRQTAVYEELLPLDHQMLAKALSDRALIERELGQFENAEIHQAAALNTLRKISDGDSQYLANALHNLGYIIRDRGRAPESIVYYEEAADMRRRMYVDGPLRINLAKTLNSLANALRLIGRTDEAMALYDEALDIVSHKSSEDSSERAKYLGNLADTELELGNLQRARELIEAAYRTRLDREEQAHPDMGWTCERLGAVYEALGRFDDALEAAVEGLRVREATLGPDHHETVRSKLQVAWLNSLSSASTDDRAIEDFRSAVRLCENRYDLGFYREATRLAGALVRRGNISEAAEWLDKAIRQIESLRTLSASLIPSDRAVYFERLRKCGAYEMMVEAQLQLAKDANTRGDPASAAEHENLAISNLERGLGRSAVDLLEFSRSDFEARVRQRAGRDASTQRDYESVELRFKESRAAYDRVVYRQAITRNKKDLEPGERQARISVLAHEEQLAFRAFRQAAEARQRLWARVLPDVFRFGAPSGAAELRDFLGPEERFLYFIVTDAQARVLLVGPERLCHSEQLKWPGGEEVTSRSLNEASNLFLELLRDPSANASELAEKGVSLFNALIPPAVWKNLQQCRRVYLVPNAAALNQLPFEALFAEQGATPDEYKYWIEAGPEIVYGSSGSFFVRSREKRDAQALKNDAVADASLLEAMLLGDPNFGPRPRPDVPTIGVQVVNVSANSIGWDLGIDVGDVIVRLGPTAVSSPAEFHKVLSDLRYDSNVDLGHDPSGAKGEPIDLVYWRPTLGTTASLMLPVDSQELGLELASFQAVPDSEAPVPIGPMRLATAALSRAGSRSDTLEPLPGTRNEVFAIFELITRRSATESAGASAARPRAVVEPVSRVLMLLKDDATESELYRFFSRSGPKARILHLATHGMADVVDGYSFSRIALTLPVMETAEDNGFLTLTDLFARWHDLLNRCELVVLSACETQVGPQQQGDAVFALPLGFQYAGCATTVASLWDVDDDATSLLMMRFYENLYGERDADAGERRHSTGRRLRTTKAEALREAKVWLRNLSSEESDRLLVDLRRNAKRGPLGDRDESAGAPAGRPYEHPYYWAAFILIGDPG